MVLFVAMCTKSTINRLISGYLFAAFLRLGSSSYQIGFKQWVAVRSSAATARDPDLVAAIPMAGDSSPLHSSPAL